MPLREAAQPVRRDVTSIEDEKSVMHSGSSSKKLVLVFATIVVALAFVISLLVVLSGNKKDSTSLIVDSNEKKTIVVVDENTMYQKRCETPCVIEGLLAGPHEISFTKPGFVDVKDSIFLSKGENKEKFVKMYRIGEQKTMITVKSDPDGATLYINDKKVQAATPTIVNDIPVGLDIVVRVEKHGYYPYEENIGKVPANMNKEVSVILKSKNNSGSQSKSKKSDSSSSRSAVESGEPAFLTINSMPWANIYIDGKLVGSTPISKHKLPAGSYKIQFKNPKSKIDKTIPIELKPGETKRLIEKFD